MKKLALVTVVVVSIFIGGLAVWQMHEAVQFLLVALALAAGLDPGVRNLVRRGVKRSHAVLLVVGLLLVVVLFWVILFAARLSTELPHLLETLPTWYEATLITLYSSGTWALRFGEMLPTTEELAASLLNTRLTEIGSILISHVGQAVGLLTVLVLMVTMGMYWLIDQPRIERLWLSLLPVETRLPMRSIWKRVFEEVGLYVRLVIFSILLTSLLLLFIYSFVGLPGAAALALFGGLMQIVPLLALPLALLPAVLVASTHSPLAVGLTFILGLAGIVFVRFILQRRLFPAAVNVNPVLVVVLIMTLGELGGIWLSPLAPPLAAALVVITKVLTEQSRASVQQPATTDIGALQARLTVISAGIRARQDGSGPLTELLSKAQGLVDEAEEVLESRQEIEPETPSAPFSGIEPAYK